MHPCETVHFFSLQAFLVRLRRERIPSSRRPEVAGQQLTLFREQRGMALDSSIEVHQVTKIFGSKTEQALQLLRSGVDKGEIRERCGCNVGVNQASFNIQHGELFVIMGLSGSGKSTLLRCLNRLIEPTAGNIIINNQNIVTMSKQDLLKFRQKQVSMVFQQFALLPHRTVAENVAFGLEIQNVPKSERQRVAEEKLSLVGLEGWGNQYPENLSGGMKQRVGLARALANDPAILLMDEAFSALDPLIRDGMQRELLNLQDKLHKTVVFITHDLNEALRLGARIALMKDGEIVQIGTPDDIIANPANDYVAKFVRGVDITKVLVASDVMRPALPLLSQNDSPRIALRVLNETGLSSGFVVDFAKRLLGIVSADRLANAIAQQREVLTESDIEVVTPVHANAHLDHLVNMILRSKYPLPVIDDEGVLCGLIFKSSILEAFASQGGDAYAPAVAASSMGQ